MNARYNIKKRSIPKFCQTILLGLNGQIVKSCDTIFLASSFHSLNVITWFDLMESVFPSIVDLEVGESEISFTKIHAPCDALPGFYDFSFSKILIQDKKYILWYIYDYTNVYQELLDYQQKKNELDIQRQYFEYKNRRIDDISDIQDNRTFFQGSLNKNQHSEYFMVFQQIVSSRGCLSNLLKIYGSYDNLCNLSNALNDSITKVGKELKYFLASDKEHQEEIFDIQYIKDQLKQKLAFDAIVHDVQFKLSYDDKPKFYVKQNVLLHIIYSLIINGHFLNANKQTSILCSIDENVSQSFLKLTILEDTIQKEEANLNIDELYTRLTFLRILTENHDGFFHTRFEEGSYTLAILIGIPIKFL